ncbi:MAG: YdaS family helix-turn-helix protein [Armatimonadia bacterium]
MKPTKPTTRKSPLQRAIDIAGSPSRLAAKATEAGPRKIERQHIGNWLQRNDGLVSADYVIQIAKAVDFKVTPHQLRPDLYPNETDGMPQPIAA